MPDSDYIYLKKLADRLESDIARLTQRHNAVLAALASYGEDPEITDSPEAQVNPEPLANPLQPLAELPTAKPNGHVDIRMPQVANGHRLRPGTRKYKTIEAVLKFLVNEKSLHRSEIARRLQNQGLLDHIKSDHLARVSVMLSQAKGILISDQGGNWSVDPTLGIEVDKLNKKRRCIRDNKNENGGISPAASSIDCCERPMEY